MNNHDKLYAGLHFNKIADAVSDLIAVLNDYEASSNYNLLMRAAWISRVGIFDNFEGYQFDLEGKMYVTINGRTRTFSVNDALVQSVGRLTRIYNNLPDEQKSVLKSIHERTEEFVKFESTLSDEDKNLYR